MSQKKEKVKHSPTLNTIILVEDTLKKEKEPIKISELKRRLPKQVNHNTLMVVLGYLEESNKIFISLKGIGWRYKK